MEQEDTAGEKEEVSVEDSEYEDEGFVKGYAEEEETFECAECGAAVKEEKKIVKEFESESYTFCSKDCAKEFEESLG